jgi:2-haloalkanoic acid dehalogenase type II
VTAARPYDVVSFDCYGTLIDWERGIARAFADAARADGVTVPVETLLAVYHEVEPAVQAERYRSYREVLTETARRLAERLGWRLAPARAGFLADSLPGWPPFPDTGPALTRLAAAGYRLGILSNVDDELLAGSRRHFPVAFEFSVTAQDVGAYKPARPHFDRGRERAAGRAWLHAAQSHFHDVRPARALGVPVAWINRKGESPVDGVRPDRELPDLAALADWLAPAAA